MPDDVDAAGAAVAAAELLRLVRHFRRELWHLEHPFPEVAALLDLADDSLSGVQLPLPLVDEGSFAGLPGYPASGQMYLEQGDAERVGRLPLPGRQAAQHSAPVLAPSPGKSAARGSTAPQPPTAAIQTMPKATGVEPSTGPVFSMSSLTSEKPGQPGGKPMPLSERAGEPARPTVGPQAQLASGSQPVDLSPPPGGPVKGSPQPPVNTAQDSALRGLDLVAALVESVQENRMRLDASGSAPVERTASQPGATPFLSKAPGRGALGNGSGAWRPGSLIDHGAGRGGDQMTRLYPETAQQDRTSMQSPPLIQGSPDTPAKLELYPGGSHQPTPQAQPSLAGGGGSSPITALDRLTAPGPAASAGMDPGQLAELVNQALVEQARRYGVDIS